MKIKFKIIYLVLICCLLIGCSQNSSKDGENKVQQNSNINEANSEQNSTTDKNNLNENESQKMDNETKDDPTADSSANETSTDGATTQVASDQEATSNQEINANETSADETNTEKASTQVTNDQTTSDQTVNEEISNVAKNKGQEIAEDSESMGTEIVVYKADRRLELWQNGEMTGEYHIGLGKKPEGKKEKEGDKMTPEGEYYVCTKNQYSKFYLALGVSYPNIEDAQNGLDKGLIDQATYDSIESAIQNGECPPWNTALGGQIMIHGHGGSKDWTKGCIAVDDEVMDILWEACSTGTKILINP